MPQQLTQVGVVGCGTIGTALAHVIEQDFATVAHVIALADRQPKQAARLQTALNSHPSIVSLTELIRRSQLVIEAASVDIAARVAELALTAHRDVLVMSAGGLLDPSWRSSLRRSRGRLFIPSGGLCGLDGIKALAVGTIRRLQLTTRKPPKALASAPWIVERFPRLSTIRRPKVVFSGSPDQAIRAFPQNTNVAATMALAAGLAQTATPARPGRSPAVRVRVIADPALRRNVHELEVDGDCGRIQCRLESEPSRANPKTSEMAIRSAVATLRQIFEPIRIGT